MTDTNKGARDDQLTKDREQRQGPPGGDEARRLDPDIGTTPAIVGERTYEEATEGGEGLSGRRASLWADAWRDLKRNPQFLISAFFIVLFVVMAAFPSLFTNTDPRACTLSNSLGRPSAEHWFGFDVQGCDYYSNVIYGAQVSIFISMIVTGFAALIAVVFGSLAAYYGGWTDTIISRITDVWLALPFILGAIVILQVFDHSFGTVAFVLVILGWTTMLRLMRSSVLREKEADYVDAAKAMGANDLRIIGRHILPNAITSVIVYAMIFVGIVISVEATLSFLGVGLQLPAISWGLMLNQAQNRVLGAPHLLFFPGIFLCVAVFSFILMGDALRDSLDPKLR